MAALSVLHPRRIWPADTEREPELDPENWRLGGTSPGGAPLGTEADGGGNWWIGDPEVYVEQGTPHRIVWSLPGPGEEAYEAAARTGYFVDRMIDPGAPQSLRPQSPAEWQVAREMTTQATAPFASRLIPMVAHCWGNDLDDTEELAYYVAQSAQVCFNGNAIGRPIVGPGGWERDEKGTRGVHYALRVTLAAPIAYPTFDEVAMRSALFRIVPHGPHVLPVDPP